VNESPKRIDAITLFVEDLERSKLSYQDVFGLPVLFEDESSSVSTPTKASPGASARTAL
jgi:catechol 2,3-dioxygenase-like lactoylglutathione lyase family enzyme